MEMKNCPRCKGDLYFDRDQYGSYKSCIQCGFMMDIVEPGAGIFGQQDSLKD